MTKKQRAVPVRQRRSTLEIYNNQEYRRLFPCWDSETFKLLGIEVVDEQVCVAAFKTGRLAVTNKGGTCPLCGQHVQVYRRRIYKRMLKCLLWLIPEYQRRKGAWIKLKDGPNFHGGDNAKLIYWKLMVRHPKDRSLYKPTEIAVTFMRREVSIPRYAYVYNGHVLGFSEELVTLAECAEGDFDFEDLGISPWTTYGG